MSQDAAAAPIVEPAVVDWGEPDEPRRRGRFGGALAVLRRDRRVLLTAAGLAAVALVASLLGEWQVTTVSQDPSTIDFAIDFGAAGDSQGLVAGVGDIGTWGSGYLAGVFLVVAGAAVVLFGPAAGRAQVRLAALGGCGALLALLLAAWTHLGRRSVLFGLFNDGPAVTLAHGRGISAAIAGTLLLGAALFLAGDARTPAPAAEPAAGDTGEPPAHEDLAAWRPGRSAAAGDELPEEPLDLTVAPAAPFAVPPDQRT
jgi:hypothetical protein